MTVQFLDVGATSRELREELDAAIARVVESGWYVHGKEHDAFEREFAAYCGVEHCVGVANGLDALHIILRALDIGAGDEVIVPSNTFIATWLAVSYAGATPVPVEPRADTHNLDPERVEAAITPRTRAIVGVHLYGQPFDVDAVNAIAEKRGIALIEDAAQAQGARYKGRRTGGLARAAGFSFYPSKNLGAMGDGGAITTNDRALADKARQLRNYGTRVKYQHELRGFNSRLDEIQAAVLRVKLRHLDAWNDRRKTAAAAYARALASTRQVALPVVPSWADPVWHLFVVGADRRDALREHLKKSGVETLVHYPVPPHRAPAYADLAKHDLPIADSLARRVVSLPIGPHMQPGEVETTAGAIQRFFASGE